MLEHAVCLSQRGIDPGDVANAKCDGVAIEEPVRKAQHFGVLARPDQVIEAFVDRPFDPDIEHILIDVGYGDRRAQRSHAKGDVAGAAGHVEDLLTRLGFDPPHELVLPQPVHARRHGVVHDVVLLGYGRKHRTNPLGLLRRSDLFVPEGNCIAHGPAP